MKAIITYLNTGKTQTVEITGVEYRQSVIILDLKNGGFYSFRPADNVEIVIEKD